jgi:uncharacterized membrane protein YfcA
MDELAAALLPAEIGSAVAIALLVLSAATSFITSAFGIGGGVVMIGILASLLPPVVLIPIHGFVQLGSNIGRTALLIRHVEWRTVPAYLGGTVAGAALGGMIAVNLPGAVVQAGVGLFILFSIYVGTPDFGRAAGWVIGGIASFLSMFFGATGPFVANYVRSMQLGRMEHVATHGMMMTIQHVLKVLAFGLLGFAFGPYLPLLAGMIATGFLGTVIGRQVLLRTDDGKFRLALKIILTLLALRLIWAGLWPLFWPQRAGAG